MAEPYYSLKITVRSLGEKRYLSLLDCDVPGVDAGMGQDFSFDEDLPPPETVKLALFLKTLENGAFQSVAVVERVGRWLFECVLGGNNRSVYLTAFAISQSLGGRLRICVNALSPDLIELPWEFLHDGTGFVIKRGPDIVRLIEDVASSRSSYAPVQSVLLAISNPTMRPEEFAPFDAKTHLTAVTSALNGIGGISIKPLNNASRDDIAQALQTGTFDTFYFIGHGLHSKDDGGKLVCEKNGEPEFLAADDLATWIRESNELRFVYLNSCSTAVTSRANPMQGTAQRLMRDGRVSAVAAMQADVQQKSAIRIAESFFTFLRKGKSPEDAMLRSRSTGADFYSFGVPALYSTIDAPRRFQRNRLAAFLNVTGPASCAFLLPDWFLGLPGKEGRKANGDGLPGDRYYYRGSTFATADVNSAWSIARLVCSILPQDQVEILSNDQFVSCKASHLFVFGSQSSKILAGLLETFEMEFDFDYQGVPGYWVIRDTKYGNCFEIPEPHHLDYEDFMDTTDFGVIQKITDKQAGRTYFLIAGLGSRATEGCGYYLWHHWGDLLEAFGGQDFGVVIKFPKSLGPLQPQLIDRGNIERPCSDIATPDAKRV